jgi:hypothetical protein
MRALPIGISDFREMIESDYFYADKTNLINQLLTNKTKVTLFTRPRRFGKTLNMSMLRYFFDIGTAEDNKKLFKGLNIEKTEAWSEQGKYPVIFISLKDLKAKSWEECLETIKYLISNLYDNNKEIIEEFDEVDKEKFNSFIKNDINYVKLKFSLKILSELLYKIYNKKVIILIDEYDTPIVSAYANKYYDDAIEFFKNFYSSALKDNEYLQFAVMTGIMRVAKEGIFSGLNNLNSRYNFR